MTWCCCAPTARAARPCPRHSRRPDEMDAQRIDELMEGLGRAAVEAAAVLALAPTAQKNAALVAAASAVRARGAAILAANGRDVAAARARHLSGPRLERLHLDARRLEAIAAGIDAVVELPDPIGRVAAE